MDEHAKILFKKKDVIGSSNLFYDKVPKFFGETDSIDSFNPAILGTYNWTLRF